MILRSLWSLIWVIMKRKHDSDSRGKGWSCRGTWGRNDAYKMIQVTYLPTYLPIDLILNWTEWFDGTKCSFSFGLENCLLGRCRSVETRELPIKVCDPWRPRKPHNSVGLHRMTPKVSSLRRLAGNEPSTEARK